MTIIAYRGGVLAADTLLTSNGERCGHTRKIMRQGRLLIGFTGASTNFEAFRDWLRAGAKDRFTSEDGNLFVVPPIGSAVIWPKGDRPFRESEPFWALGSGSSLALGSGSSLALGAMAHGASAQEAVRIACQFDVNSGGEVTVLHRHGALDQGMSDEERERLYVDLTRAMPPPNALRTSPHWLRNVRAMHRG